MIQNPVPMTVLAEYGLEGIGVIVVLENLGYRFKFVEYLHIGYGGRHHDRIFVGQELPVGYRWILDVFPEHVGYVGVDVVEGVGVHPLAYLRLDAIKQLLLLRARQVFC